MALRWASIFFLFFSSFGNAARLEAKAQVKLFNGKLGGASRAQAASDLSVQLAGGGTLTKSWRNSLHIDLMTPDWLYFSYEVKVHFGSRSEANHALKLLSLLEEAGEVTLWIDLKKARAKDRRYMFLSVTTYYISAQNVYVESRGRLGNLSQLTTDSQYRGPDQVVSEHVWDCSSALAEAG